MMPAAKGMESAGTKAIGMEATGLEAGITKGIATTGLSALERMEPITLEEMDGIKLMNRVDTKFVTDASLLEEILRRATKDYRVLEIDGSRISKYDTLYYDTPQLEMYTAHHNRRLNRFKVRTRTYLSSGESFLEVKRKNNRGRTKKKRIHIEREHFNDFSSDATACNFLKAKSPYSADQLNASVSTSFSRITLVNRAKTERLTIDSGLQFRNMRTGAEASLGSAVIIELKQDGLYHSPMKGILLDLRVKPLRISKYCIGTVLTDPQARRGRFLIKLRTIEKLTHKS